MDDITIIMWDTYRTIIDLIKFSDTKAATLLASIGVILSIILSKIIDNINFITSHKLLFIPMVLGFIFGFISIYFCLICLAPRFNSGERYSLLFFRDIAQEFSTFDEYEQKINDVFSDNLQSKHQITQQVWANSKVANEKFIAINKAIFFLNG
jgi:hypothetical protein